MRELGRSDDDIEAARSEPVLALRLAEQPLAYDAGGPPAETAPALQYLPERALAMAVLRDAVECYAKHARARSEEGRRELDDVRKWVESRDRSWPFSFENICELFDIDAERLRSQLARYEGRARAPHRRRARVVPLRSRRRAIP
jgi:hypothetical protein